ncbi:hypothetical protein C8J57DRAFT_1530525 [Mycena rebaudengoi]|nr:hypothetical protein C8J57DRAFT_1530525 [Mycena rebaudengoi]
MSTPVIGPSMNWVGYDMTEVFAPLFLGTYEYTASVSLVMTVAAGTVVSLVLSGITIMQAYVYFPTNDRGFLQIIAILMIVFDLISTGLIAQGLYYYIVPNFGSLLPLGNLNPSLAAECFMSVFIVFVSHLFFALQIYSVIGRGPNKYGVPGAVAFFGAVSFAGAIGCVITMFRESHNILTNRSYKFAAFVGIAKGAAAVADIIATVALCFFINESKGTNSMIKRLIGYVLQRGILVTLIQVTFLVIFFTTSTKFAWLAFHVNVTRTYANTFFAMLNARSSLKKKSSSSSRPLSGSNASATYNAQNSSRDIHFAAAPHSQYSTKVHEISIEKTTEYSSDA